MKKYLLFSCIFLLLNLFLKSQTVNAYAKVTGVVGPIITVSNVNETFDTFENGEEIIIMQMQDDVIGGNTNDNSNFGDLAAIANAGKYEIAKILSHTEAVGVPVVITLTAPLINSYNLGANSSVQIISYRKLGSPNYTTTSNLSPIAWDGDVGGVLAVRVEGTLTLSHNIVADALGFRGGTKSANDNTACSSTPYRSNSNIYGAKGEGIFKPSAANQLNARAKIINGGGGGSANNGGGGGGGNYTGGGIGGPGWQCSATQGYGYGGVELSSVISGDRVFMGGGGGGGQQNNSVAQHGAKGGGIIFLQAAELKTVGGCGSLRISANGGIGVNSGNDGAGGAGAGGSIVLDVNSYAIAATCPLVIASNGGTGGTVGNSGPHGAGGGGGQGYISFSGLQPTTNVTTTTLNGIPGCNNNINPCTNSAGLPTGLDNAGIFANISNPLPIKLLGFTAVANTDKIDLKWVTEVEVNNDFFTIERSKDAKNWEIVVIVGGAGNSNQTIEYFDSDYSPVKGISYYRLKQTDFDGKYSYSNVVPVKYVKNNKDASISLFPNPVNRGEEVKIRFNDIFEEKILVVLRDAKGKEYYSKVVLNIEEGVLVAIPIDYSIPAGFYLVTASSDNQIYSQKILVE